MKEGRRMLSHEELSSRSKTRIPDQFMESELAKKNIQDHIVNSLEVLKDESLSWKMSVKEVLFELSKIYIIVNGARRTLLEIPERSQKIADAFGLKLYPNILWS